MPAVEPVDADVLCAVMGHLRRLVGCRLCRCDVSDCCDTNTRAGG